MLIVVFGHVRAVPFYEISNIVPIAVTDLGRERLIAGYSFDLVPGESALNLWSNHISGRSSVSSR